MALWCHMQSGNYRHREGISCNADKQCEHQRLGCSEQLNSAPLSFQSVLASISAVMYVHGVFISRYIRQVFACVCESV